jgi:parallel beta-helix repeat protein
LEKKLFCLFIFLIFLCSNFVNGLEIQNLNLLSQDESFAILSREIKVDDEGDGNFTSIQAAINNALPGDTIRVYSGIYNESLHIDTNGIIIEGIDQELGLGEDEGFPIVDGGYSGDVIILTADNIVIRNLIIRNSGQTLFDAGIHIYSDYNTITRCVFYGNRYGINVNLHDNNIINENIITLNLADGIIIFSSKENTISKNNISDNELQGIFLLDANQNLITQNVINLNGNDGVHISDFCQYNEISYNTINLNGIDGIKMFFHDNNDNILLGNTINYNVWNGIHFMDGHDNQILFNSIYANHFNGIHYGNADRNKIIGNTVSYSSNEGIFISDFGRDNEIYYNNIIFNTAKDKGENIWNNEFPLCGNHWTYYNGVDANDDGIGDTPFLIPGGANVDNFPIMQPVTAPNIPDKPKGRAIIEANKIYTYSTSTTDSNNDSFQYGWDWNGDKVVDQWTDFYFSGEKCEVSHMWDEYGSYIVYVNARDIRGMVSEWSSGLTVVISREKTSFSAIHNLFNNHLTQFSAFKILLQQSIFR